MTSAVPLLPYLDSLIADPDSLYHFLCDCQLLATGKGNASIVSFCQKIAPIDPLAILAAIASSYPHHSYWENRRTETAILGYGITLTSTFNTKDRFFQSQQFIKASQKRIIKLDHYSDITSHFFCNFTFFESKNSYPFPSATVTLPKFQILKKRSDYFLITNLLLTNDLDIELLIEEIKNNSKTLQYHLNNLLNFSEKPSFPDTHPYCIHPIYNFKSAVTSALKSIDNQHFSKIVLAHALDVVSPVSFSIINCLNNLRNLHPDCYIFSISDGKGHHFIGASPERLLSIYDHQLITDALAGSAPRGKTIRLDILLANKLLSSEKERREHQAVSDYISQNLSQLGLSPQRSPLRLLKLSNIQHLWTPIHAQIKDHIHPLEIVAQLHPTPAVAGVPTEIACEEIRHYETFDRSLYAAPLGWIDCLGNSEFIVGIRSALIEGNQARLYAGAGIVAGSEPDRELAETQLKFQALLKALS